MLKRASVSKLKKRAVQGGFLRLERSGRIIEMFIVGMESIGDGRGGQMDVLFVVYAIVIVDQGVDVLFRGLQ